MAWFMSSILLFFSAIAERVPPGHIYDFTGWKLQKCSTKGEVEGDQLQNFSDQTFFLADDKGIAFRTPDKCSFITAHADHPRTELRDIAVPEWEVGPLGGVHIMRVEMAVLHAADASPITCIGQIHGVLKNEERAMLVKLEWQGGRVEARVKNSTAPYDEFGLDLGSLEYGERFAYEIRVERAQLTVTLNGRSVTYLPPVAPEDAFYFKAGNYNQCGAKCDPNDYAEVHIYAVNTSHQLPSSEFVL